VASLETKLEEVREDYLAAVAGLESEVKRVNEDNAAQVADLQEKISGYQQHVVRLETTIEVVREGYLAAVTELESKMTQTSEDNATKIAELKAYSEQIWNTEIEPLKNRLADLEAKPHTLNVAYLRMEEALTVFTDAVRDLRQRAADKQEEIVKLKQKYLAGTGSKDDYQKELRQLQLELLRAQLYMDIGTINRILQSSEFSDVHSDLERLKKELQPLLGELHSLLESIRIGGVDPQELEPRYTQANDAFTQIDQLLIQVATTKIMEVANTIAVDNDYDLVLRSQDVIIYGNPARLTDISDVVKTVIAK
jgi:chromosome segregation ATPase